jgi:hypothetical protein
MLAKLRNVVAVSIFLDARQQMWEYAWRVTLPTELAAPAVLRARALHATVLNRALERIPAVVVNIF